MIDAPRPTEVIQRGVTETSFISFTRFHGWLKSQWALAFKLVGCKLKASSVQVKVTKLMKLVKLSITIPLYASIPMFTFGRLLRG
jgi:hypothetical protein